MKKIFALACAAFALFSVVACGEKEPKDDPTPEVTLSINPTIANVGFEAGTTEIEVTANCEWTVTLTNSSDEAEWVSANPVSGNGNGKIVITYAGATSLTDSRSVMVNVTNGEKTLQAKVLQAPLELGDGEVLILGVDGVSRVWSIYNLAAAGEFVTDIEEVGAAFMFNSKTAWPFDITKNAGVFGGNAPRSEGMVPVAGFMDAVAAYSCPHTSYDENGTPVNDDTAWKAENDPCPEGYHVPTQWDIIATLGYSEDHCATKDYFNCVRVEAGERGFSKMGFIVGWGLNVPDDVTKDNITEKGGMFVPVSGWISSAGGYIDRDWLVCLRGATSLDDIHGGLFLSTYNDYCDHWGWGDGIKTYASAVRCVKTL